MLRLYSWGYIIVFFQGSISGLNIIGERTLQTRILQAVYLFTLILMTILTIINMKYKKKSIDIIINYLIMSRLYIALLDLTEIS